LGAIQKLFFEPVHDSFVQIAAYLAFNNGNQGQNQRGAPDPLIGFGLPVALAVGRVLIGVKFLSRKR